MWIPLQNWAVQHYKNACVQNVHPGYFALLGLLNITKLGHIAKPLKDDKYTLLDFPMKHWCLSLFDVQLLILCGSDHDYVLCQSRLYQLKN